MGAGDVYKRIGGKSRTLALQTGGFRRTGVGVRRDEGIAPYKDERSDRRNDERERRGIFLS